MHVSQKERQINKIVKKHDLIDKKKAQTQRSQFVDILSQDCQLGMKKKTKQRKHKANTKYCHF